MFSEDIGAYTHSIYNNFTEIVGRSNSSPLSMEEYILLRKQAVCELEQGVTIRDSNNKVIPIGSSEVGTNVHATSARTPSAGYVRHESGNLVPDHAPNVKPPSSGNLPNQSKATANAVAILNSLPD